MVVHTRVSHLEGGLLLLLSLPLPLLLLLLLFLSPLLVTHRPQSTLPSPLPQNASTARLSALGHPC